MTKPQVVICPYCGESQPAEDWCRACGGFFDELSRQATHNDMGPWFLRNPRRPFQPGCSYETIIKLIERGQIVKLSIIRGPTSKQYWTIAKRVPGIAHLLGYCHSCDAHVQSDDHGCPSCGVPFGAYLDRNHLGLPEVKPLPWEADYEEAASVGAPGVGAGEWSGAESHGISSFARDADIANGAGESAALLDAPPAPPQGGSVAPSSPSYSIAASEPGPASPAPATGPQSTTPALRSLRRELARQRRLSTLLIAFLVVSFVVLLLTNLDALVPGGSSSGPPPQAAGNSDADAASNGSDSRSGDAVDSSDVGNQSSPPVTPSSPSVEDTVTSVEGLLKESEDPQRPLSDRIKDCEAALRLLEAADATDQRIEALLDRTRRELEELRLRELADP